MIGDGQFAHAHLGMCKRTPRQGGPYYFAFYVCTGKLLYLPLSNLYALYEGNEQFFPRLISNNADDVGSWVKHGQQDYNPMKGPV